MIPTIQNIYFDIHASFLSDDNARAFATTLPFNILSLADEWGWNDPVVKEKIRDVIQERKEMDNHPLIAPLHDIIYDVYGISMSNNDVLAYAGTLPYEIHSLAKEWGWQDTEVKDMIYVLIQERKKNTTR